MLIAGAGWGGVRGGVGTRAGDGAEIREGDQDPELSLKNMVTSLFHNNLCPEVKQGVGVGPLSLTVRLHTCPRTGGNVAPNLSSPKGHGPHGLPLWQLAP